MLDEEKKAIDYLQLCYDLSTITNESLSKLGIVLNLIKKQSKEIEKLKEDKYGLEEEVQMQAKNIMLCEEALCEMQEKENKKVNNIVGLIMRKCGVSNLIINEEELCFSVQNEVCEIYDPINHYIKLILKED